MLMIPHLSNIIAVSPLSFKGCPRITISYIHFFTTKQHSSFFQVVQMPLLYEFCLLIFYISLLTFFGFL